MISSLEVVEPTLTFGILIFVDTFVLLFVVVDFLFVTGVVVVLDFGWGWKISKENFPSRWQLELIEVVLHAAGSLFLIGTVGICRSTLFTRRLSTIGFCNRGVTTGLAAGALHATVGESIGLFTGKIGGSRWRLFKSKRRANSSFFSCISGVSSVGINGGETLGSGSIDGIVNDFDKISVDIGGKGVYDDRIFSLTLSQTVSNVSSRRSCVESTGMLLWRW